MSGLPGNRLTRSTEKVTVADSMNAPGGIPLRGNERNPRCSGRGEGTNGSIPAPMTAAVVTTPSWRTSPSVAGSLPTSAETGGKPSPSTTESEKEKSHPGQRSRIHSAAAYGLIAHPFLVAAACMIIIPSCGSLRKRDDFSSARAPRRSEGSSPDQVASPGRDPFPLLSSGNGGRSRLTGEVLIVPFPGVRAAIPAEHLLQDLRPLQPVGGGNLPLEENPRLLPADPPLRRGGLRRGGGRQLLPAPGSRPHRDRPRRRQGSPGGELRPVRKHHHPADGEKPLPHPRKEHQPETEGTHPRLPHGAEDEQGGDPLPVPEPDLPRGGHIRGGGGSPDLFRKGGGRTRSGGGGNARRPSQGTYPLFPEDQPRPCEGRRALPPPEDGRSGVPHAGEGGQGVCGQDRPRPPFHLPVEGGLLSRTGPLVPHGKIRVGVPLPGRAP